MLQRFRAYIIGAAAIFDFAGVFFPTPIQQPQSPSPQQSLNNDWKALSGDWQAISQDFSKAHRRYAQRELVKE